MPTINSNFLQRKITILFLINSIFITLRVRNNWDLQGSKRLVLYTEKISPVIFTFFRQEKKKTLQDLQYLLINFEKKKFTTLLSKGLLSTLVVYLNYRNLFSCQPLANYPSSVLVKWKQNCDSTSFSSIITYWITEINFKIRD